MDRKAALFSTNKHYNRIYTHYECMINYKMI